MLWKAILDEYKKTTYNYNTGLGGGNHLRIAICDDDAAIASSLHDSIEASGILPPSTELSTYSNGSALIRSHSESPFDIVFLDIEMDGLSGLEVGQEIRNTDKRAIIIFVTSHRQYVFQSFSIEPFDYIVKPVDNFKLSGILARAIRKYSEQRHRIHFKWKESAYVLDVNDVVYLESSLRRVIFVTKDNRYECIGKIDDYEKDLSRYGFFRCHQSYLINMNYIKSVENTSITTSLGHDVYMSARRRQDCLKALNLFLTKHKVVYGKNPD